MVTTAHGTATTARTPSPLADPGVGIEFRTSRTSRTPFVLRGRAGRGSTFTHGGAASCFASSTAGFGATSAASCVAATGSGPVEGAGSAATGCGGRSCGTGARVGGAAGDGAAANGVAGAG